MTTQNLPRRQKGFTLIELMIAVVVVAILGSIAVPAYRDYVLRSHRSEANSYLLQIAADQEKWYLQNNTYSATLGAGGLGFADVTLPGEYYDLAITAADATGFTATATARSERGQDDDTECAFLSIDETGLRFGSEEEGGDNNSQCWKGSAQN